jgi:hypothetical protein
VAGQKRGKKKVENLVNKIEEEPNNVNLGKKKILRVHEIRKSGNWREITKE